MPAYVSGSSTLSTADVRDKRLKPWKTKPSFLLRIAASASPDSLETSLPSRKYEPDVGVSRQPMMFMNVDLPDPDGPMMAMKSPPATESETPSSAATSSDPRW